jgi:hypothetical protein
MALTRRCTDLAMACLALLPKLPFGGDASSRSITSSLELIRLSAKPFGIGRNRLLKRCNRGRVGLQSEHTIAIKLDAVFPTLRPRCRRCRDHNLRSEHADELQGRPDEVLIYLRWRSSSLARRRISSDDVWSLGKSDVRTAGGGLRRATRRSSSLPAVSTPMRAPCS